MVEKEDNDDNTIIISTYSVSQGGVSPRRKLEVVVVEKEDNDDNTIIISTTNSNNTHHICSSQKSEMCSARSTSSPVSFSAIAWRTEGGTKPNSMLRRF